MCFRWNSPLAQVLVGVICFCCPGIFNALNSMGGGGQVDSKVGQNAKVALYTCFAIFGLLAGAIHNKPGPKWTILIGCATYVLYAGSLLCYNHTQNGAFTIAAGGILGCSAGMLWTAQGVILMAYPRENDKGKFIGYFWAIFNAGAVLGSVIGKNLDNPTYIAFIFHHGHRYLDLLVRQRPLLSTRAQSLNNIFYWFSQIGGSWSVARILDYQGVNRKTRSLWGLVMITACFVATWVSGVFFQKGYKITDAKGNHDYTGRLTYCYWLMGALSNDVNVFSRYAGFYKCIQSCGAAIAWRINAVVTPFMTELIICFALLVVSIPGALFLSMRIKDHFDNDQAENNRDHHDMKKTDA
ncbi:hypothetical protein BGZ59_004142 [Podila verticillata]|nr:hypothetical protein BGZ59_004142 [Podila verticillata]